MFKGSKRHETVGGFILMALAQARRRPRAAGGNGTALSTQARAPGCPLSAGLQVLVREHVELTVHPTTFIPAEKRGLCSANG